MGSIGHPTKDSPDLHLVIATEEEDLAQQHANSDEWRGALSLEAYFRREALLSNLELTKDGGLTAWMLVHQPDPNGSRQVLCGCETVRKHALAGRDGKVDDVIAYGVASVFCPKEHRGRGYAGRMIADLGNKLKTLHANGKQVLFSVLFSDIGKDFYAARGWYPFPSAHVSLPASTNPPSELARPLEVGDLGELCAVDERLLRTKLAKTTTANRSTVALLPDLPTLNWHHAREDFVAKELGYGKTPAVKGAIVGNTPGSRVWMYFTRVWSNPQEEAPNTLHILRLVIEDESFSDIGAASPEAAEKLKDSDVVRAIAALFSVAQAQAAQWDMKEVTIWNPTSATLAAAQSLDAKAAVVHRETESITSLRWYGESGSWRDVDWVSNEKYGWC